MSWRGVLDAVDAVESWIVLLPSYVQIPLMLAVFLPIAWYGARLIDRLVEFVLRKHHERGESDTPARAAGGSR